MLLPGTVAALRGASTCSGASSSDSPQSQQPAPAPRRITGRVGGLSVARQRDLLKRWKVRARQQRQTPRTRALSSERLGVRCRSRRRPRSRNRSRNAAGGRRRTSSRVALAWRCLARAQRPCATRCPRLTPPRGARSKRLSGTRASVSWQRRARRAGWKRKPRSAGERAEAAAGAPRALLVPLPKPGSRVRRRAPPCSGLKRGVLLVDAYNGTVRRGLLECAAAA